MMASTIESPSLKNQFELLQRKQKEKLERRKNKTADKQESSKELDPAVSLAFGINDDLNLKLGDPPKSSGNSMLLGLSSDHQEEIRQLKDENGRLYKLLSEKDFEVQRYKKKLTGLEAAGDSSAVSNEHAASKIVELSKKIRELNVEMEKERTKARQLTKKCADLDKELQQKNSEASEGARKLPGATSSARPGHTAYTDPYSQGPTTAELKELQEKLKQAELKVSEYRNQSVSLKKDLNMANKVIEQEVGEGATVQQLLNNTSGWRGRAEQITALQKKVNEMKMQQDINQMESSRSLNYDLDPDLSKTKRSAVTRQMEQLRRNDKERREAMDRQSQQLKAMEADYELLKAKMEGFKARNKSLSDDNKKLKSEIQNVIGKSDVDDQLIQKLTGQVEQLKQSLLQESTKAAEMKGRLEQNQQQVSLRAQQEGNIVAQLQQIISDKDSQIKRLEQNLQQPSQAWGSRPSSSASVNSQFPVQVTAMVVDNPQFSAPPTPQTILSSRPSSKAETYRVNANNSTNNTEQAANVVLLKEELDVVRSQCEEFKCLSQAASVERDKQTELVQLFQQRVQDASNKLQEAQSEVILLKRKNVELERKLGRAGINDKTQSAISGRRAQSKTVMSSRGERNEGDGLMTQDELQTQLEIQRDENQALKLTLKRSLDSKEQEIKVYKDMLDQTKTIFLQGLRQYRQQQGSS